MFVSQPWGKRRIPCCSAGLHKNQTPQDGSIHGTEPALLCPSFLVLSVEDRPPPLSSPSVFLDGFVYIRPSFFFFFFVFCLNSTYLGRYPRVFRQKGMCPSNAILAQDHHRRCSVHVLGNPPPVTRLTQKAAPKRTYMLSAPIRWDRRTYWRTRRKQARFAVVRTPGTLARSALYWSLLSLCGTRSRKQHKRVVRQDLQYITLDGNLKDRCRSESHLSSPVPPPSRPTCTYHEVYIHTSTYVFYPAK